MRKWRHVLSWRHAASWQAKLFYGNFNDLRQTAAGSAMTALIGRPPAAATTAHACRASAPSPGAPERL